MKKTVLVLTFIFTALISLSQTTWTIPKTEGSTRNLTTVPGGFRVPNGIIIGRFADTTAANLTSAKFHDGSVILVGESLYQRQLSSNRWLIIGNVGVGGGSIDYVKPGYGIKVDSSGRVYTVTVNSELIPSLNYVNAISVEVLAKLNLTDTAAMLAPYSRVTISSYGKNATRDSTILLLSNGTRYAAKDSIGSGGGSTDTNSLSNRINLKLNASDTASMLSPYLRSALAAASYATTSHLHNTSDITSGTLPIARGGTGLSAIGTVGQSLQVATGGTALEYVNIPSLINTAINLKLNTSDTATMLSPYPLTSEVRQVVSDSTREFTIGVGLELTNDTLLSLKEVTPGEIGGVTQEQVDLWNSLEPSLGLPSVNGYVLSSGTDGNRSWVDYISPTGSQTLTNKRITPRVNTIASNSTPTPTSDISDMFTVTALATNATFAIPTGTPTDGQSLLLRIKDNGTARTLGWNAIYRAGTDFALPTTTVISKTIYLQLVYNAADSKWDAVGLSQGY